MTAEELIDSKYVDFHSLDNGNIWENIENLMITFAKQEVEKALKTASGNARMYSEIVGESKQELEEAAEKWVFETNGNKWSNNDDTAGDNYGSFIAGFKCCQEQTYSEEEIVDFINWIGVNDYRYYSNGWAAMFNKPALTSTQLFEKFKKK
jgi:hypothetical protein